MYLLAAAPELLNKKPEMPWVFFGALLALGVFLVFWWTRKKD